MSVSQHRLHTSIALLVLAVCLSVSAVAMADDLMGSRDVAELCAHSDEMPDAQAAGAIARELGLVLPEDERPSTARALTERHYAATRAELAMNDYQLRIKPADFSLVGRDALTGTVHVAAWDPFPLFDGRFGLRLDVDVLDVPCAPDASANAELAWQAGLLALDVHFGLRAGTEPSHPLCTSASRGLDGTISGVWLTVALTHVTSGETLCEAASGALEERKVRLSSGEERMVPRVEVTHIERLGQSFGRRVPHAGGTPSGGITLAHMRPQAASDTPPAKLAGDRHAEEVDVEAAVRFRYAVETALLPCYQQTLCRSGKRQGGLTLRAHVDAQSRLQAPTVTVDALDSEYLVGCALEQLSDVQALGLRDDDLGWVVIFRLDHEGEQPTATLAAVLAFRGSAGAGIAAGRP